MIMFKYGKYLWENIGLKQHMLSYIIVFHGLSPKHHHGKKKIITSLDHSSSEYLHKDASAKLEFTKSVNCLRVRYEAYD